MKTEELLPPQIAETEEECDPLLLATLDFEEAARFLDLENWIVTRLRHTEREVTVNLPLARDAGEDMVLSGLRVQHHSGSGVTLGPVRLASDAHLHEIKAAAMNMTWQAALLALPFGGAAGAIIYNPEHLSEHELKAIAREYGHALHGIVGAFSDVLMPDGGCNEQTMAWMLDNLANHHPDNAAGITGKPVVLGGMDGFYDACAIGLVSLLSKAVGPLEDLRVALQGFDDNARRIASELAKAGAVVTAVADNSGGLYNAEGIDVPALINHVEQHDIIFGYSGADAVVNANVLESECDMLVLAATERQLTVGNAAEIRARLVVEVTDGSVTRAAEQILQQGGTVVIPRLLATAGATIAAHMEWAKNVHQSAAAVDLRETISAQMSKAFSHVKATAEHHGLTLRRAAVLAGVEHVAAQMRLVGRG